MRRSQKGAEFRTSEIALVTYLTLRGFTPERRSVEAGRAALHYEQTADLESALIAYQNKCSVCGIAFSEVASAMTKSRAALLDGRLEEVKK